MSGKNGLLPLQIHNIAISNRDQRICSSPTDCVPIHTGTTHKLSLVERGPVQTTTSCETAAARATHDINEVSRINNSAIPAAKIQIDTVLSKLLQWHKALNRQIRMISLVITLPTLFCSVAVVAGISSLIPILAVAAVGILAGVMIAIYANTLSDNYAGAMSSLVADKSCRAQAAGGVSVGSVAAGMHGATARGTLLAGAVGAISGGLGGYLNRTEYGMAGANASGAAVGTVDTLSWRQASVAMQFGAATGGMVGGWFLGTTAGSAQVGEMAGYGALYGGMAGRVMDYYLPAILNDIWWDFMRNLNSNFNLTGVAGAVTAVLYNNYPAGMGEWSGAMLLGCTGAACKVIAIKTDEKHIRAAAAVATAFGTARKRVSFSKLLRAARNQFGSCFEKRQAVGDSEFQSLAPIGRNTFNNYRVSGGKQTKPSLP